jgi:hypothetical protein
VFDLLMRRFDALTPYRAAIEVLRRELPADPLAALAAGAGLLRSMRWMLEAAGISGEGIGGMVAVKLTAAAYLATARVWVRDESPDLARDGGAGPPAARHRLVQRRRRREPEATALYGAAGAGLTGGTSCRYDVLYCTIPQQIGTRPIPDARPNFSISM